ncbi:MAG: flavin reductase family protein [Asgard group archaeon]|nr:flavin reductase family protein [Asgard group archaeon]
MTKIEKKANPVIYPAPPALVSAYDSSGNPNAMAAAWITNISLQPPALVVGIRKTRYTFELIEQAKVFGVNLPSADLIKEVDYFGMVSGRDTNKFDDTGLELFMGSKVKVPLIVECPINVECKLLKKVKIGTHHAIFGEILTIHYDKSMLDDEGKPDILLGDLAAYGTSKYYQLKKVIGTYGFSKK